MIFGATTPPAPPPISSLVSSGTGLPAELATFQSLLNANLQAVAVVAGNPTSTTAARTAAARNALKTAADALTQISATNKAAAGQMITAFIIAVGRVQGTVFTPTPVPGSTAVSIVPPVALSFFEEHATAIKIGGGIAIAGLVGYAVLRRRSRR
jgi:hypothetical protein